MSSCSSHTAEVSKVRQVAAATDKLRREKWRAEESQRIKEATVRGLEPEIQRIIAKSKSEMQKMKALHEVHVHVHVCTYVHVCNRSYYSAQGKKVLRWLLRLFAFINRISVKGLHGQGILIRNFYIHVHVN